MSSPVSVRRPREPRDSPAGRSPVFAPTGSPHWASPGRFRTSACSAISAWSRTWLRDRAAQRAKSLPYGEQRRLEIARTLATEPKLLVLDEPAAGMNPQEKVQLMSLIRRLRDEFGVSILLIEHDMRVVMG